MYNERWNTRVSSAVPFKHDEVDQTWNYSEAKWLTCIRLQLYSNIMKMSQFDLFSMIYEACCSANTLRNTGIYFLFYDPLHIICVQAVHFHSSVFFKMGGIVVQVFFISLHRKSHPGPHTIVPYDLYFIHCANVLNFTFHHCKCQTLYQRDWLFPFEQYAHFGLAIGNNMQRFFLFICFCFLFFMPYVIPIWHLKRFCFWWFLSAIYLFGSLKIMCNVLYAA